MKREFYIFLMTLWLPFELFYLSITPKKGSLSYIGAFLLKKKNEP